VRIQQELSTDILKVDIHKAKEIRHSDSGSDGILRHSREREAVKQ
jgi:hypothetical protein